MIEVSANLGPFETRTEKKWYSMADTRLALVLYKMDSPEIDEAVRKALEVYKKIDWKDLSIQDQNYLGVALAMSGNTAEAWEVLSHAVDSIPSTNKGWQDWIRWQAGWAAWLAEDKDKYEDAFASVLKDSSGKEMPREQWDYSQWISALFLGIADDSVFLKFCADDPYKTDDPHFFFGEKMRKAGKLDKARQAYEVCVNLSEKAGDTFPAMYARYRLKQIKEKAKTSGSPE